MLKAIAVILALGGFCVVLAGSNMGLSPWYGVTPLVLGLLVLIGIRFFNGSSSENISIKG